MTVSGWGEHNQGTLVEVSAEGMIWTYGSKGSVVHRIKKPMTDILRKLLRKDLRRLKPGDWVAWSKSNWGTPESEDFSFHEAQVMAHPVHSAQYLTVLFNGLSHQVAKNQLYKVQPVISVEDMHTQYDYNS